MYIRQRVYPAGGEAMVWPAFIAVAQIKLPPSKSLPDLVRAFSSAANKKSLRERRRSSPRAWTDLPGVRRTLFTPSEDENGHTRTSGGPVTGSHACVHRRE
jgi:hypothetical protein